MAHAQGRGSHRAPMHQQAGAMVSDLGSFGHFSHPSYRIAIALPLGLRRDTDAARLTEENMMVGKGHLTGREHEVLP
jgi:hypothetical protein